jgi:hypothetical protein
MERNDLTALLRLAELVQARARRERDPHAKDSLEKDLTLIKDELGRVVLSLPSDVDVFPAKEEDGFPDSDAFTLGSEIPNASPPCPKAEPPPLPAQLLGAKFESFMKAKAKAKRKSRIPVPSAV